MARWKQHNVSYALSSSAYLEIRPIKDLVIRSQASVEIDSRISDNFTPDFVIDPANEFQTNNSITRNSPVYRNWSVQNTLTYLKTFTDKHNFTAMVGNTFEEWNSTTLWGSYDKMPNNSDPLQELDAGTINPRTGGNLSTTSLLSYLGRITYNYADKYYLTATYRVDGSSKFMDKNKWASFPSASVAWRISNETFMEGVNLW